MFLKFHSFLSSKTYCLHVFISLICLIQFLVLAKYCFFLHFPTLNTVNNHLRNYYFFGHRYIYLSKTYKKHRETYWHALAADLTTKDKEGEAFVYVSNRIRVRQKEETDGTIVTTTLQKSFSGYQKKKKKKKEKHD